VHCFESCVHVILAIFIDQQKKGDFGFFPDASELEDRSPDDYFVTKEKTGFLGITLPWGTFSCQL
jgi:hypothetical protein